MQHVAKYRAYHMEPKHVAKSILSDMVPKKHYNLEIAFLFSMVYLIGFILSLHMKSLNLKATVT